MIFTNILFPFSAISSVSVVFVSVLAQLSLPSPMLGQHRKVA